jgi:DHA1 family bicyclomycin/chloramphenicol resistance-like MFS transporter
MQPGGEGHTRVRIPSVWLLGLASGLSSFGVTIVIPAMVAISAQFNADYASVQFVISAYILGISLAQPFIGILCDQIGRRPVMLAGFAMFVVASIGASWTDSLSGLIVLRFLQAVGASVGTVAARAVVRDTRSPLETTVAMGQIAAIMGFAPIAAPAIGGWLGAALGYRSVFIATAALGLLVLILMYRTLPETLDRTQTTSHFSGLLKNYRALMRSRRFWGFTLVFGFVQGSFFTFMAVGAAVFEADLGLDARDFGTTWALMSVAYVLSAMASSRLTRTLGSGWVFGVTVVLTLLSGWLMFVWTSVSGATFLSVLAPLTLLMIGAGGVLPASMAGVVNAHPEMSGTASGLSSALAMLFAGAFTVLSGVFYKGTFETVAILITISTTITALSWLLVRRSASH